MNCLVFIAGMYIKISSDKFDFRDVFRDFLVISPNKADMEIVVKTSINITKPKGKLLVDDHVKWVSIPDGFFNTSLYLCPNNSEEVICRADVNRDWSKAEIVYYGDSQIAEYFIAGFVCEVLFRNRLLFKNGLVLHASAISWNGQGIAFTAPSGTGKSTQGNLWADYMGAEVLNDDRPALKLYNNKPYLFGTPWSGAKSLYQNGLAPLKAIVLLEQALENTVSCLSLPEALSGIIPRCFLPYYDQDDTPIMNKCLDSIGKILSHVPIFHLKCRPDQEAVEKLYQAITSA